MEIVEQQYIINDAIELSYNNDIIAFWKPYETYDYLCQWYKSVFTDGTYTYNCMEQYMMAQKALLFNDMETLSLIIKETRPDKMKNYGRLVKNFNNEIWNKYKFSIVYNGNLLKFSQNSVLKNKLISTGNSILVEASPFDNIWGVKLSADNENINYPEKWQGENLLGFALMQVRNKLKII